MSHHATGVFSCRHVSVAIPPPMKWTLSKPEHLESITFDFKHAGTRIKVQTRHMVLINIQSLPVTTADTWETDQWFSGQSMVEWATIKSCEEHSILMYRRDRARNIQKCSPNRKKVECWLWTVVVCLFLRHKKFSMETESEEQEDQTEKRLNHQQKSTFWWLHSRELRPFWWTNPVRAQCRTQEVWDPTFRCRTRNL